MSEMSDVIKQVDNSLWKKRACTLATLLCRRRALSRCVCMPCHACPVQCLGIEEEEEEERIRNLI